MKSAIKFIFSVISIFCIMIMQSSAQVNINQLNTPYTQNFNTLTTAGNWADNSTLPGWYARTTTAAAISTYGLSSGEPTAHIGEAYAQGMLASFGSVGNGDRAIGFVPTDAFVGPTGAKGFIGWRLKNNTGYTITRLEIHWKGEQWRDQFTTGTPQTIALRYQMSSTPITSLSTGLLTTASSSFSSLQNVSSGTIDGNNAANSSVMIATIDDIQINNGYEIMLRWEDVNNGTSMNHLLAFDDVTVTAYAAPQSPVTILPLNVTTTSFTAMWNAAQLADYYYVDLSSDPTFPEGSYDSYYTTSTSYNFNNLQAQTSWYYRVIAGNTMGTSNTSNVTAVRSTTFTGSGAWNLGTTGSWSDGIPGSSPDIYFAYIESGAFCLVTAPAIFGGDFFIKSSGSLKIMPGQSLTLLGNLTNLAGTSGLIIKSDATGTGSLIHNTNNVDGMFERYISGSNSLTAKKYHLVSVPVTGNTYQSGVWLDSYLFTYLEASDTWKAWDDPTTNTLNTHEGAMIYYPDYNNTTSKTYLISGKFNNGDYAPIIHKEGNGYNLVPNPYPSALDWNAVAKTNVNTAVWMFNPAEGVTNYESYNNGISTGDFNGIVPVGQAFFVKANGPGLTFTNACRVNDEEEFFKHTTVVENVLYLKAQANGGSDRIAIRLTNDATSAIDDQFDAVKFYGDLQVPQLSSFTEFDNTPLSINAVPPQNGTTTVPVRFDTEYTGEVIFTATGMESFDPSIGILIEDTETGNMTDLRIISEFTSTQSVNSDPFRFKIHFEETTGFAQNEVKPVKIYSNNGNIILDYKPVSHSFSVQLFDLQGRLVLDLKADGTGHDILPVNLKAGVYMAHFLQQGNVSAEKLIVQ